MSHEFRYRKLKKPEMQEKHIKLTNQAKKWHKLVATNENVQGLL